MPLTDHEVDFLAAFIYEATTEPFFSGRATKKLHANGIGYTDLSWLLTACGKEHPATRDGNNLVFGKPDSGPPECPWSNRETALRRVEEIKQEMADDGDRTQKPPG